MADNFFKKYKWFILIVAFLLITSQQDKKMGTGSFGCSSSSPTIGSTAETLASGVEVYFTDAPFEEIESLDVIIEKIELSGQKGIRTILATQTQLRLRERLVQKVAGVMIPKDTYQYINIYFKNTATSTMNDGSTKQIKVKNQILSIDINQQVNDDEIISLVVDIPLVSSINQEGADLVFEPKQVVFESKIKKQIRSQIQEQVRQKLNERIQLSEQNTNMGAILEKYKNKG